MVQFIGPFIHHKKMAVLSRCPLPKLAFGSESCYYVRLIKNSRMVRIRGKLQGGARYRRERVRETEDHALVDCSGIAKDRECCDSWVMRLGRHSR
jgi:hypothetical protein